MVFLESVMKHRTIINKPGIRNYFLNYFYIFLLVLFGCDSNDAAPDLGGLYTNLAREEDPDRNPIIVIPGVLGTKLFDTESNTVVWGEIGRGLETPEKDEEKRRIALPMQKDIPLNQLRDGVIAEHALESIKLTIYGITVEKNAYGNILASLGVGGFINESHDGARKVDYGDRHFTSFQFA